MALGKTNRVNAKSINLKLRLKENGAFLDVPYFEQQEKQGEAYVGVAKHTDVAGDLISIEGRIGDYEGDPIYNVKLGLLDASVGEVYYAEYVLSNGIGRSLSNSLLNLKGFKNVQLGLYGQRNKETKKIYPAISLRQDSDETVKWLLDPKVVTELQPRLFEGKLDKETKKPKIEKDWSGPDEFLFNKVVAFGKTIKRPASTATPVAAAQSDSPPATESTAVDGDGSGDDVDPPF